MNSKKAFEGDTKYQKQKEVSTTGLVPGLVAYEPYKKGSTDPNEAKMLLYWDTIKDSFFDKGNRWSFVAKQLKQMYSDITQKDINDLYEKARYYIDQYQLSLKSNFGLIDGPKDLGKNPSGDFPSVQWMPKGQEDLDVDPNVTTATFKTEQEKILTSSNEKTNQTLLKILSKDKDSYIRANVAKNRNTPLEVLAELSLDQDEFVREAVDLNPLKKSAIEERKFMITDMGEGTEHRTLVDENKNLVILPRYGVWRIENGIAKDVIETSNDLDVLKKKYNAAVVVTTASKELKAIESPLTQDEQNQIAAKYGAEYNTALAHIYFAAKRGHSLDKAIEYAINEMKKVNISLEPKKLVEAMNLYVRTKL
jgi:hypothetical protein